MYPDCVVYLMVDLLPGFDVFRREPAPQSLVLEVGVNALGELFIFARKADEAGVVPDRMIEKGR